MCCSDFETDLEVDYKKDPGKFGGVAVNRNCTDIFGLIIIVLYLVVVIALTIYCCLNSDVDKYLKGYDSCGNICGRNNININSMHKCFGKNMEEFNYAVVIYNIVSGTERSCSKTCLVDEQYCTENGEDKDLIPFYKLLLMHYPFKIFAIMVTVGVLYTFVMFSTLEPECQVLLRWMCSVKSLLFAATLWKIFAFLDTYLFNVQFECYKILLSTAIIGTLGALILLFICTKPMVPKITVTQELLAEIKTILGGVNLSFVLPSISIIIITSLLILLNYCWLNASTFSYLDIIGEDLEGQPLLDYVPYFVATFTKVVLIFAFLLLYEVVRNFQCMVVGGTVAQWYFTRRNGRLIHPVRTTVKNIFRYHFGSLCWSACLLSISLPLQIATNVLNIISTIITYTETIYSICKVCVINCGFLTRNGLIITAIHGCDYCEGKIRCSKLLSQNMFNASSIFAFGDWVMLLLKLYICFITFVPFHFFTISPGTLFHLKFAIAHIGFVIWCCVFADCYYSVFTVTQRTLVLCFCEDCLYNNGTSKPYHMSPEFAQYIENVNIFVDQEYWENVAEKWKQGPKKLYG